MRGRSLQRLRVAWLGKTWVLHKDGLGSLSAASAGRKTKDVSSVTNLSSLPSTGGASRCVEALWRARRVLSSPTAIADRRSSYMPSAFGGYGYHLTTSSKFSSWSVFRRRQPQPGHPWICDGSGLSSADSTASCHLIGAGGKLPRMVEEEQWRASFLASLYTTCRI
jgi:hypothetical protein